MVTFGSKDKGYEIGYLETGKPKSTRNKKEKDHFKLNGLAKAAIDLFKQSKHKRVRNDKLLIFTINVAGDMLEIRHMYKDDAVYKNCLLERVRIPLSISHIQPDDVYSLIHALLTFRNAIVHAVHQMFNKESDVSAETSSMMSVDQ